MIYYIRIKFKNSNGYMEIPYDFLEHPPHGMKTKVKQIISIAAKNGGWTLHEAEDRYFTNNIITTQYTL